jgi:hypothetical protein
MRFLCPFKAKQAEAMKKPKFAEGQIFFALKQTD